MVIDRWGEFVDCRSRSRWRRYRRVGTVTARRQDVAAVWKTGADDRMEGAAGDWLVEDASGGQRTVSDQAFRASHRHVEADKWERCSVLEARRAKTGEVAVSQEGTSTATAGDWVVRDAPDNAWIVPNSHFRTAYKRSRTILGRGTESPAESYLILLLRLSVFGVSVAVAVLCVLALGVESTNTPIEPGSWVARMPFIDLALSRPGVTSVAFLISVGILAIMIADFRFTFYDASRTVTIAAAAGISTITVAFPPFYHCRSESDSLWSTLADTAGLFTLTFERDTLAFADERGVVACMPPSTGMEMARVLALVASSAAIVALLVRASEGFRNRMELARHPERAIVAIGLDDDAVEFLKNVKAGSLDKTVYLLTVAPDRPCVRAVEDAGVRIITVDIDSERAFRKLFSRRVRFRGVTHPARIYLLSADPAINEKRLKQARAARILPDHGTEHSSLETIPRVVVRIDDVWQAEDYQNENREISGYAVDVVGIYASTADALLGPHLAHVDAALKRLDVVSTRKNGAQDDENVPRPGPLVIVGSGNLTLAMLSWMADRSRELRVLREKDVNERLGREATRDLHVIVISHDADDLCDDHTVRQLHRGGQYLLLDAIPCAPDDTKKRLTEVLDRVRNEDPIVVFTDDPGVQSGSFAPSINYRFADIPVFQHRPDVSTPPETTSRHRISPYGITLAPRNAVTMLERWGRLGLLLHAKYILGVKDTLEKLETTAEQLERTDQRSFKQLVDDWRDALVVSSPGWFPRGTRLVTDTTGNSEPQVPRRLAWQPAIESSSSNDFHPYLVEDNIRSVVMTLASLSSRSLDWKAPPAESTELFEPPWSEPEEKLEESQAEELRSTGDHSLEPWQVKALMDFGCKFNLSPEQLTTIARAESESWRQHRCRQKPKWQKTDAARAEARSKLEDQVEAGEISTEAAKLVRHLLTCAEEQSRQHLAMASWEKLDANNRWSTYCTVMETASFLHLLGYFGALSDDSSTRKRLPDKPTPLRWTPGNSTWESAGSPFAPSYDSM